MTLEGVYRQALLRLFSGVLPLYVINEYPKSGGSWVGQMLSEAIGIPFPRNTYPPFRSILMQGHFIHPFGLRNVLVLWRDGRDVMVSWYHHCLFHHENAPPRQAYLVERTRREFSVQDYEDVKLNLPRFIEYVFTEQKFPGFTWSQFVRQWHGISLVNFAKYEDLRSCPVEELRRIVAELTGKSVGVQRAEQIVDRYSFERQSGRRPGQEKKSSFMRKGVVGDWKNHFNLEARRAFDYWAGDELILLGYEKDRSWVEQKG